MTETWEQRRLPLTSRYRPFIEVLFKTLSLRPENGIAAATTSTPHESNSSNENRLTALLLTLSIRDGELGRTIRTCADLTETVKTYVTRVEDSLKGGPLDKLGGSLNT